MSQSAGSLSACNRAGFGGCNLSRSSEARLGLLTRKPKPLSSPLSMYLALNLTQCVLSRRYGQVALLGRFSYSSGRACVIDVVLIVALDGRGTQCSAPTGPTIPWTGGKCAVLFEERLSLGSFRFCARESCFGTL